MEQTTKQRLIGAGIIILLAVVFVPMLIAPEQKDFSEEVALEQPAFEAEKDLIDAAELAAVSAPQANPIQELVAEADIVDFTPANETADEETSKTAEVTTPAAPATVATNTVTASPQPSSKPAAVETRPAKLKNVQKSEKTVAKLKELNKQRAGWSIQLATFSNQRNASVLQDKLRAKGIPSYSRTAKSGKTNVLLTRVYAGPNLEKSKADAMLKKLKSDLHLNGMVVVYNTTNEG